MLRTLYNQIGQYKRASLATPLMTALEVVMDVLIPYVTAMLIDKGIMAGDMQAVYKYGLLMVGMAFLSLLFGIMAGRVSAYAATGFASNLRKAIKIAEAAAPCVLWIDEIEKAFSGSSQDSSGDSGVGRRMFGKFLTMIGSKNKAYFPFQTAFF